MLVNCKGYRCDIALLRILCIVVVVFFPWVWNDVCQPFFRLM